MNIDSKLEVKQVGLLCFALLLVFGIFQPSKAADWDLKDNNGVHYRLSDLKGKWVLVNFWAPWCATCIHEMPDLVALQKEHKDVLVIGVAVMFHKTQEVTDIVNGQALSYPIVIGNEDIASDFGEMQGMPTSFLYSPSGELVDRIEGGMTKEGIDRLIRESSRSG